jgi:UDP-N-acetylmuramoyl-tripeptide--D-alanyl-D-alanine ligase
MASQEARLFSAAEAARIVGGSLAGNAEASIVSVVADSRRAGQGSLYVALPGERADGHDFIAGALGSGASCVLARADRREASLAAAAPGLAEGRALVFVDDVLAALQTLATAHRLRHPGLLRVGITGSSGKTTTKECAAAILGRSRSLVSNEGNLNSDIGLSLSMFSIRSGHEIGVFEMGMNRAGEMGELAAIYEPDLALITNVGTAHIGILGSKEAVAKEKKMIFSRFDGRQTALVREDEDCKAFLLEGLKGKVREYGARSTTGFRGARDLGLDGWEVDWEGLSFRFPLAGRHNLMNAVAAMAIAEAVGTAPRDVAEGLASVEPLFGRSEVLKGDFTLIRDCYNANPDSDVAAIAMCDELPCEGRRVYVLGSMLELGKDSEAEHRRVGRAAAASKAHALFFFGEESRPAFEEAIDAGFAGRLVFETDFEALRDAVRSFLGAGDLILLKASRGVELERLSEALVQPSAGFTTKRGEHHAP